MKKDEFIVESPIAAVCSRSTSEHMIFFLDIFLVLDRMVAYFFWLPSHSDHFGKAKPYHALFWGCALSL